MNETDFYEHSYVELSDDERVPTRRTVFSHSDNSEQEDDNNGDSCDSESSEVCGAIASNKFAALEVSDWKFIFIF